jgi:hypothetical protein
MQSTLQARRPFDRRDLVPSSKFLDSGLRRNDGIRGQKTEDSNICGREALGN